jgi:hypothetical protein
VNRLEGQTYVQSLIAGAFTGPAGFLTDEMVAAGAGIDAGKVDHQHQKVAVMSDHATNASAKRQIIHVAEGAGTITSFGVVASVAATGDSTATITLRKNGSAVLTGSITLDASTAAFAVDEGTLSSASYVAGDVFEADVSAVSAGTGTLPKGVACVLVAREAAQ